MPIAVKTRLARSSELRSTSLRTQTRCGGSSNASMRAMVWSRGRGVQSTHASRTLFGYIDGPLIEEEKHVIVEQIWTGNAYRNFNYLIVCPDSGEALAVDPL